MTSLTPEQRVDKNGRLVTRHVRNGVSSAPSLAGIPAPSLPATRAKKAPTPKTVQKLHSDIHSFYADERLKAVFKYGAFHFTCSDAEAYEVMSVTDSSHTALRLLGAGVRSKQEAIAWLDKHELTDLQQDNGEVVEEVIRRGLPAIPTLLAFNKYGVDRKDQPNYFDAVEAYTVRSLREATGTSDDIPHKIWMDEISLSDVRAIGATRLATAEKKMYGVVDQLEAIHKGESPYDLEALKGLITLGEETNFISDTIVDAKFYGAEFVLGMKDWRYAKSLTYLLPKGTYNKGQIKEIMKLSDDLRASGKFLNPDGLQLIYGAKVSVKETVEGLDKGLELSEIVAIKEGIQPSVTSGWL